FAIFEAGDQPRALLDQHAAQRLREQIVLAAEVSVEAAGGEPRLAHHAVDAGAEDAALSEQARRGRENSLVGALLMVRPIPHGMTLVIYRYMTVVIQCQGRYGPMMILYQYWQSSSSWRVRWALRIKGLEFEQLSIDLRAGAQLAPEHRARNPMGYVPALVVDGRCLAESVAILEWLDETHPNPSLYPK